MALPTWAHVILLTCSIFITEVWTGSTTVSLDSGSSYSQLHFCVQDCLLCPEACSAGVGLNKALSCAFPWANDCYCATTAAGAASSYLTNCVRSSCSQDDLPRDVTIAVDNYNSYCLTAGYTLPGALVTTSTIAGSTGMTGTTTSGTSIAPGNSDEIYSSSAPWSALWRY